MNHFDLDRFRLMSSGVWNTTWPADSNQACRYRICMIGGVV